MMERWLRGTAGFVVLLSLGLTQLHSPKWLLLTAFMGLNLLQSAFTNWCPSMPILRSLGIEADYTDKNK
ncbi:MAG: DUF2892 domain-containing protein [Deltaproteobacteria bacterium]|nr:DUF2892 domain-containing protein [Deltaproteobacteria bacterium]